MNCIVSAAVNTPDGQISGVRTGDVSRFFGIPYARAPKDGLRLRSPLPVQPWTGVRDGAVAAPASLQTLSGNQTWLIGPIERQSEDCLYLNVWTPDVAGHAPVLFWLHGGQTRNGHAAGPGIDGAALAARGLVVVTANYRLGALGGLAHPDLRDPRTGLCANWGLQDQLAALHWVSRCIGAFGGNPTQVTLAGQSSGAANAVMIAQHRLANACYARVIAQSPPLFRPPMYADLNAAAEYTEAFAASLGVSVVGLRDIDGIVLQQAEHAFGFSPELESRMGRPRTAPVLDGQLLRHWPQNGPALGVPLLAGWTRDEADFWFNLQDGSGHCISPLKAPNDSAALAKRLKGLMKLHYAFDTPPSVDSVLAVYAGSGQVDRQWSALYTDLAFRAPVLHLLGRNARAGVSTWAYEFAHPMVSAVGASPHATEVPLVFGTFRHPHFEGKIGDEQQAACIAEAMGSAWSAFVRQGDPGRGWHPLDPANPQVMQFGADGASMSPLLRRQALDCWPAFQC